MTTLTKRYRRLFLISTILVSFPLISTIYGGWARSLPYVVGCSAILFLWWAAYVCLHKSLRGSFAFSFVLINLCWWPLFIITIWRLVFIVQNGGMDRADGYGSPMAFLLGVIFEQAFFLPFTIALIGGVRLLLGERHWQDDGDWKPKE